MKKVSQTSANPNKKTAICYIYSSIHNYIVARASFSAQRFCVRSLFLLFFFLLFLSSKLLRCGLPNAFVFSVERALFLLICCACRCCCRLLFVGVAVVVVAAVVLVVALVVVTVCSRVVVVDDVFFRMRTTLFLHLRGAQLRPFLSPIHYCCGWFCCF